MSESKHGSDATRRNFLQSAGAGTAMVVAAGNLPLMADEQQALPARALGTTGVMQALSKAQRDGLTRFIGVSGHNRPDRFLDVLKDFEIQVMMNAVSFVSRHIYNFEEKVWPEAHRRGVALVAMKVYGGGIKAGGGRIKSQDVFDAFRYAQGLPNISTVVIGMYNEKELEENLRFARRYTPLAEKELADLVARGKRLAKSWGTPYGPVS